MGSLDVKMHGLDTLTKGSFLLGIFLLAVKWCFHFEAKHDDFTFMKALEMCIDIVRKNLYINITM